MEDILITDRALEKIREIAANEHVDLADTMLRVAVVPGGCSGLTYDLGWDTTEQEGDRVMQIGDVRIVLDRRSRVYLSGTELDFSDGLEEIGRASSRERMELNITTGRLQIHEKEKTQDNS